MTPGKRGLVILLALLLLPLAFAAHTTTISNVYVPVYETNSANITVDVENDFASTSAINSVDIQNAGFDIITSIVPIEWMLTNNNSLLFTTETSGISNWGSQKFGFETIAQNVDADSDVIWTITTTDRNLDTNSQQVTLRILNDNTAPILSNFLPGAFTLGSNSELFSSDAADVETAIDSANLFVSNCDEVYDNATNSSAVEYDEFALTCADNVCSINQDLSSWSEGDICFYFEVSNKGGETANSGDLTTIIDRTAPVVTATNPADGQLFNVTDIILEFNAQDNYDTELDCTIDVDGVRNTITATSADNTYSITAQDGIHTWSVSCSDEVGLAGATAARTFSVDTLGPNITISVPAVVDRGNDTVIDVLIEDIVSGIDESTITAAITDTDGNISSVTITNNQIIYPTTISTVPGDYVLQITAKDLLGHEATQTAAFRIRETFAITMNLQSQIDASTPNNTVYAPLTGTITKDDGSIVSGTVGLTEIVANETIAVDNGSFSANIQIPETNGAYIITAIYTNGIDIFTQTIPIAVGPYCGNNIIDAGEQCDGSTTAICSDYGFSLGTTSCTASCTIDSSQCSNPPPAAPSSGGGSKGRRKSSSSGIFVPVLTAPVAEEPEIVEDASKTAGIVEQSQEEIKLTADNITNFTVNTKPRQSALGIGAAWATLTNFAQQANAKLLAALLLVGMLLYVFGWRKKEDNWDDYFRKYGHN